MCGSTSATSIEWLKTAGVDVIGPGPSQVSDPGSLGTSPGKSKGESRQGEWQHPNSPSSVSVGLAFKLAHALVKPWPGNGEAPNFEEYDLRPLPI